MGKQTERVGLREPLVLLHCFRFGVLPSPPGVCVRSIRIKYVKRSKVVCTQVLVCLSFQVATFCDLHHCLDFELSLFLLSVFFVKLSSVPSGVSPRLLPSSTEEVPEGLGCLCRTPVSMRRRVPSTLGPDIRLYPARPGRRGLASS